MLSLMVDKDVTYMESLRLMVSLEKPLYSTVRGQPLKPLYNQGCLGPASPIGEDYGNDGLDCKGFD